MNLREVLAEISEETWVDALSGDRVACLSKTPLPVMPPQDVQRTTVGREGKRVMTDANAFRLALKKWMAEFSAPVGPATRILDFGCGWARILRLFLKDVERENLLGVDVQDWLLDVARKTAPMCPVLLVPSAPPCPLESGRFDLIYAYSVFSHLPEKLATNWIRELTRLLAPKGLLVLTTRPRAHLVNLGAEITDNTVHDMKYASVIKDQKKALELYDSGGFVFYPAGGHKLSSEEFGEAVIPRRYVEKHWVSDLELMGFFERYSDTYLQPAIVFRAQ